jgi:hypothetical protein
VESEAQRGSRKIIAACSASRHHDIDWRVRTDVSTPGNAAVAPAWCSVVANFAESSVISINYENQVFKEGVRKKRD